MFQEKKIATAKTEPSGLIWDIKRYTLHDGPGIRTTVFFKGCPLSCIWCCNPESQGLVAELTWIRERCLGCGLCSQICPTDAVETGKDGEKSVDPTRCNLCEQCAVKCPGEAMNVLGHLKTVTEVLSEVAKDDVFFQRSGGGLTLSGGEPLAQAEFATELLRRYKTEQAGHTAVETCGQGPWESFKKILPYTDLFLFDLKHFDPVVHSRLTGADNQIILANATRLAESSPNLIFRLPLIPGYNDDPENLKRTAEFVNKLRIQRLDLLPYHRLGEPKYRRLKRFYPLEGIRSLTDKETAKARWILEQAGLKVRLGG